MDLPMEYARRPTVSRETWQRPAKTFRQLMLVVFLTRPVPASPVAVFVRPAKHALTASKIRMRPTSTAAALSVTIVSLAFLVNNGAPVLISSKIRMRPASIAAATVARLAKAGMKTARSGVKTMTNAPGRAAHSDLAYIPTYR